MTFVERALPKVIFVDDTAILGPFCAWCGNQLTMHREGDLACPKRRLSPLLPTGLRERGCNCRHSMFGGPVCPVRQFHPDLAADRKYAETAQRRLDSRKRVRP